jgi:hypothetical protein
MISVYERAENNETVLQMQLTNAEVQIVLTLSMYVIQSYFH